MAKGKPSNRGSASRSSTPMVMHSLIMKAGVSAPSISHSPSAGPIDAIVGGRALGIGVQHRKPLDAQVDQVHEAGRVDRESAGEPGDFDEVAATRASPLAESRRDGAGDENRRGMGTNGVTKKTGLPLYEN